MLKRIILRLKKEYSIDCSPAVVVSDGRTDEHTLAVTDDKAAMSTFKSNGIPVLFVCDKDEFVNGADYVTDDISQCDYAYLDMVYSRQKNIPLEILETPRCRVREMTVGDLPALYEMYDDEMIRKYTEPLYDYEKEKEYTESYIRNMYGFYGFGLWLAFDKASGRLAGRAGISIREIDGKSCHELGYIIASDFRQKGYATEICTGIIEYAFETLGFDELYLVTEKDNPASVRTAKKLGFSLISEGDKYFIYKKESGHE